MLDPTFFNIAMGCTSFFSIMLPLVVIAIVIHQSPESMKTYRRFIIHFTVCDFCFSVCMGMLVKPFPIIPFFAAFVIGPLKYLGSAGAVASGSAIMISAGYAIATQCICIVYRFAAIQTDPRLLAFVVSWISWTIGHIIGVFISVFAILLLMQVQVPQEEVLANMEQDLKYYPNMGLPNISGQIVFYPKMGSEFTVFTAFIVLLGFSAAEVVSIGCIYMILRQLESKKSNFSKNTYKLHRQLTIALGLQLFAPLIFFVLPVSALILDHMFHIANEFTGLQKTVEFLLMFIDLYGAANSIITLYCIKPYRNFIIQSIRKSSISLAGGNVRYREDSIQVAPLDFLSMEQIRKRKSFARL